MKKLMGHDPNLKFIVLGAVMFQMLMAYMVQDASWVTVIALAYCLGGTINHSMSLAIHEISHNLAFGHGKPLANRIIGFIAILPIGIPVSIAFRKYHLEHHRYQGDTEKDVDIPSEIEAKLFTNTVTKFLWVILQPFFYTIRPLFMRPKPLEKLEFINMVLQFSVDFAIVYFWGVKPLVYMIAGTLLATGLHPMAGHFISEHYMFKEGYETYSYYGPLNYLTFNVGYHNEHHDFPSIPGSRLPEVCTTIVLLIITFYVTIQARAYVNEFSCFNVHRLRLANTLGYVILTFTETVKLKTTRSVNSSRIQCFFRLLLRLRLYKCVNEHATYPRV